MLTPVAQKRYSTFDEGAVTISESGLVTVVTPAPLAATAMEYEPANTVASTVTVATDDVDVSEAGANKTATPLGAPDAASDTAPAKLVRTSDTLLVLLPPAAMVSDDGDSDGSDMDPLEHGGLCPCRDVDAASSSPVTHDGHQQLDDSARAGSVCPAVTCHMVHRDGY